MDGWMQRLYTPTHDFRKTGVLGDFRDRYAGLGELLRCAASGQNLDATLAQGAGKFDEAGLVGNADQRAANGVHTVCTRKVAVWMIHQSAAPAPAARLRGCARYGSNRVELQMQTIAVSACRCYLLLAGSSGWFVCKPLIFLRSVLRLMPSIRAATV